MTRQISLKTFSLEIPNFISCLSQNEIDKILERDDADSKIIAAGVHPKDGKVMIILASCRILSFDGDSYKIPRGRYIPHVDGDSVFLPNENGRWSAAVEDFSLSSKWIIKKSVSASTDSQLFINNKSIGTFEF